jgi:hypothetical protein
MKKPVMLFVITILLIIYSAEVIYSAEYTIFMRDGGTFEASRYVIEGDSLKVFLKTPKDAIVVFPRAYVDKIVKNEDEETNRVSNNNKKKHGELCDAENIRCDQYYCCHELDIMQTEMASACDFVEEPRNSANDQNREYRKNNCIRHKRKMASVEESCPNCYVVKMCCKPDSSIRLSEPARPAAQPAMPAASAGPSKRW